MKVYKKTMNVTIRPATAKDLPAILEIVNYAIAHSTAIYEEEARTPDVQAAWYEDKLTHGFPVIVAEYENRVVGFGAYGTFRQKTGYRNTVEHSVYVVNDLDGKGIGSLLLAELIRLAKVQHFHVMIGGIDASNTGSIAFHKKFGFTVCGICPEVGIKFGKWLDLMLMQLILE
ncbi:MAG TPA: GNAT family N-acetyltransferase [Flavobacterium sp.]|nr:GNAT family N-acetyltransferase [Flavobacterium sp.]